MQHNLTKFVVLFLLLFLSVYLKTSITGRRYLGIVVSRLAYLTVFALVGGRFAHDDAGAVPSQFRVATGAHAHRIVQLFGG